MKFKLISLFPEFFDSPLKTSLLSKAIDKQLISVERYNPRDFSKHKNKQVDDTPYGGGSGMVLMPDVLAETTKAAKRPPNSLVILTDPAGQTFDQELASSLANYDELILISGRYEGVDQRFKDKYVDLEISIGDFVLNGGEVASLVILETVARLIPGVLGNQDSLLTESFSGQKGEKLLEYPQYTKPLDFEGEGVPEILLSGNHQEIARWRKSEATKKTVKLRPDLIKGS